MKKTLLLLLLIISLINLSAAPFRFLPYTITQPNGEVIECFVSGDEFFNWIHDKDGYTIIQSSDGYFYYAIDAKNKLAPSDYRVKQVKPETIGVKPWLKISKFEYQKRVKRHQVPASSKSAGPNHAPHTGTLNNIVIYIRFSGESEIATTRQTYDDKLNTTSGISLKSYYTEVSYNNLTISSTHYPTCASPATTNASYQDSHTRGYFQPYNATTNIIGYQTDSEASDRESQLLYDAVTWINSNSPVSSGINIDGDADGNVDNVCFMIKGNSGAWADLLWAHRSALYTKTVNINGKKVYDYTFQPESQVTVNTLCHEMFHALGAPDLYHYDENVFSPVGGWDIMESGAGHMGAYMKWKYADAKWISSIPVITTTGTYSLNPLTSIANNCYRIASPNSDKEFFVVEYRKQGGNYESNLTGSGLLIYRINTDFVGNASFDNISVFDEVYIYRPTGSITNNGYVSSANYNSDVSRTSINDVTNPSSFLHDGLPGGLDISNVSSVGSTISFNVYLSPVVSPQNFVATGASESQINLTWNLNASSNDVLVAFSASGVIGAPTKGTSYSAGGSIPGGGTVIYSGNATSFNHTALTAGTNYFYRIWSKNSTNEYSPVVSAKGATMCSIPIIPIAQGFNGSEISPCWTVTVVAVGASKEEPASITQVKTGQTPDAVPVEGTHMIKFNSTYCGAGNILRLSSPTFSSVGQSQLYVNFAWHKDTQWPQFLDNMKIQWSANGSTWNDGTTYQRYNTVTSWTQQSYKLPDAALNQSDLRIAFLFTSEYGYNCYLDDVKIQTTGLGIEGNSIDEVSIYPNPTKGLFKVHTSQVYNNMRIEVRDICGKLVYSEIYSSSNDNIIDLTNQAKGLYLLTIHADNKILNQKVVVE